MRREGPCNNCENEMQKDRPRRRNVPVFSPLNYIYTNGWDEERERQDIMKLYCPVDTTANDSTYLNHSPSFARTQPSNGTLRLLAREITVE